MLNIFFIVVCYNECIKNKIKCCGLVGKLDENMMLNFNRKIMGNLNLEKSY